MSDDIPDWEAKYWANRQKQLDQAKSSAGAQVARHSVPPQPFPQAIPQNTHQLHGHPYSNMNREVDAAAMLHQRQFGGALGGTESSGKSVLLREGITYYRQVQNPEGFATTMPLIRSMGKLNNVAGKEFAVMGKVRGYCIDNLTVVDASKINENPERLMTLVRVRAPFAGDLLIPESAMIDSSSGSRQILLG